LIFSADQLSQHPSTSETLYLEKLLVPIQFCLLSA
jgi:hypothetical protein